MLQLHLQLSVSPMVLWSSISFLLSRWRWQWIKWWWWQFNKSNLYFPCLSCDDDDNDNDNDDGDAVIQFTTRCFPNGAIFSLSWAHEGLMMISSFRRRGQNHHDIATISRWYRDSLMLDSDNNYLREQRGSLHTFIIRYCCIQSEAYKPIYNDYWKVNLTLRNLTLTISNAYHNKFYILITHISFD